MLVFFMLSAMILAADQTTEVEKYALFRDDSAFMKIVQGAAIPLIANASHVFMRGLNSTEVIYY
jgi:hypothetical protein